MNSKDIGLRSCIECAETCYYNCDHCTMRLCRDRDCKASHFEMCGHVLFRCAGQCGKIYRETSPLFCRSCEKTVCSACAMPCQELNCAQVVCGDCFETCDQDGFVCGAHQAKWLASNNRPVGLAYERMKFGVIYTEIGAR